MPVNQLKHDRALGAERGRSARVLEGVLLPLALSIGISLFFFLTNFNIPFANGGNCDPWDYFGRFFIADQMSLIGPTRVDARLPATVIGFVNTLLFKGVMADYANFMILFAASTVAVYDAARRLFGLPAAAAAAIFFATEPLVVGDFSVTYTAPAVAYVAVAMAFAVAASTMENGAKRTFILLAGGFFWGSAVHAHLYSLSYSFIVPLYCLDWRRSPLAFAFDALSKWILLLLGAIAATVFFGLINFVFLHGSFLFFLPQLQDAYTVSVRAYQKPYWYLDGGRAALMVVGIAASIMQGLLIWRRGGGVPETRSALTSLVPFVALVLAQVGYTFYGGITLQYDYYFVWLIAPLALLIGGLVRLATLKPPMIAAVLVLYLAGCLAAGFGLFDLIWETPPPFPPSLGVAIAFIAVMFLTLRSRNAAVIAGLLLLAGSSATIRPEKIGLPVWQGDDGRDMYERLRAGMTFISGFRFMQMPKFWITTEGDMWEAIAYPRGYSYCLVDTALPNFFLPGHPEFNADAERFSAGDTLVIVPPDAKVLSEALQNLKMQKHLALAEIGRTSIDYVGVKYLIVIGQLQQSP